MKGQRILASVTASESDKPPARSVPAHQRSACARSAALCGTECAGSVPGALAPTLRITSVWDHDRLVVTRLPSFNVG